MRKFAAMLACFASTLLHWTPAHAEDITWLSADFPPLSTPANSGSEGYIDLLLKAVQKSLPHHNIQQEVLPWPRILFLTQRGGPYCTSMAAQTPERETYLRFTAPYGYVYPVGVVIHAKDQEIFMRFLNKAGDIRLQALLEQEDLRLGIAASRSYGTKIDEMLRGQANAQSGKLVRVNQDSSTQTMVGMLLKNRFDYTLAYPAETVFQDRASNRLRFYSIAENSELIAGRFSCTKGPETDQTFADLSKLATSLRDDASLLESYERWLPPYLLKPYRQRLARQLGSPTR